MEGSGAEPKSASSPKSDTCPARRSFWALEAAAIIFSRREKRRARSSPEKSKAPARTRDSRFFLLTDLESRRLAKSSAPVNSPPASRSQIAASMAALPTFLTAAKPNRIALDAAPPVRSGANFSWLLLMSGGKTLMPMFLHSSTKTEILSVLLISFESREAMNSTG